MKRSPIRKVVPTEHEEQCTFVEWLETKKLKFSAIPNGGGRSMHQAMVLKKEGVRGGLPDMLIIVKDHLVWIEMKRSDLKPKIGGKGGVSDEQWRWIDALNRCNNVQVYVCYGAEEAMKVVDSVLTT